MKFVGKNSLISLASAVLLGLLWFIVVDEKQRMIAAQPTQLLDPGLANQIEITQEGVTSLLQKNADQWFLTAPIEALANEQRVMPLLALLTVPDSTPYPVDEVDLLALGLSNPVATIKINEFEFIFGGPGPGERQRYLRIDKHVYLTRDIVLPLVAGGPEALIAPANQTQ